MRSYEEIMELVGKTAEVAASNTKSTAQILDQLRGQGKLLSDLSGAVDTMRVDFSTVKDDVEQLKLNEEITTSQTITITVAAERRIYEILGDDPFDHERYYRVFISRLYSDARKKAGLGARISTTRKGNFQRCIDYIEAWTPSCGCAALYEHADKLAAARVKAKKLGYA